MGVTEGEEPVASDEADASISATNVLVYLTDGRKHRRHVEMCGIADLEVTCTTVQRHSEHVEQKF